MQITGFTTGYQSPKLRLLRATYVIRNGGRQNIRLTGVMDSTGLKLVPPSVEFRFKEAEDSAEWRETIGIGSFDGRGRVDYVLAPGTSVAGSLSIPFDANRPPARLIAIVSTAPPRVQCFESKEFSLPAAPPSDAANTDPPASPRP